MHRTLCSFLSAYRYPSICDARCNHVDDVAKGWSVPKDGPCRYVADEDSVVQTQKRKSRVPSTLFKRPLGCGKGARRGSSIHQNTRKRMEARIPNRGDNSRIYLFFPPFLSSTRNHQSSTLVGSCESLLSNVLRGTYNK